MRAVRQLPFSVEPVVEDRITRTRCRFRYGPKIERESTRVICLMTQRRRLDAFLVEQAVAAGAEFRDGVHVDLDSETELRVDGRPVEVAAVIGADGANGITARSLRLGGAIVNGVALEGNLAYEELPVGSWHGRLVLELGNVPGGYGWIFPKGDHVNVGVGGWESEGPRLREHLRRLCAVHDVDFDALTGLRGFRLPYRRATSTFASDNVLLVGDAAGLIDPLSGDGMYEAFVSARLAAEAVLDGDLAGYQPRVMTELGPLHGASWTAKYALDRFPRLTFAIARAPLAWGVISRIVRGDLKDPTAAHGLARAPLKALDRLGKIAQPA